VLLLIVSKLVGHLARKPTATIVPLARLNPTQPQQTKPETLFSKSVTRRREHLNL
jgi:hypothetical protein